jgi:hypothetical protein
VCSEKSTEETSVVRQRLDETRIRVLRCQREYTSVAGQRGLVVMVLQECPGRHRREQQNGTFGSGDLYSVSMKLVQSEIQSSRSRIRESTRGLRIVVQGSSIVEVLPSNDQ